MDVNTLAAVVTLLIGLSVASERLVAIVKGLIPFLNQENPVALLEGWRRSALQALAVGAGVLTAWLSRPLVPSFVHGWDTIPGLLALGLLASGGSGFWNSIQGYVNLIKDIKKLERREKLIEVRSLPSPPDRGRQAPGGVG